MKFQVLILLGAALQARAQSITATEFLAAVNQQDSLSTFSNLIQRDSANVLAAFLSSGVTNANVYAPVDTASGGPTSRRRRTESPEFELAYYLSDAGPGASSGGHYKRGGKDYYDDEEEEVCAVIPLGTISTFLTDPKFANLGGKSQKIISKSAGDNQAHLFTGLGKIANTLEIISVGRINIIPIDSYLTLPLSVSDSLCELGATNFLESIKESGQKEEIDCLPSITIFAPLNPIEGCVDDYIVTDFLGYSTDLVSGKLKAKSGVSIEVVKKDDGSFTVNGDPITKSDILVNNGVIHFVDNKVKYKPEPTPTECTEEPEPTYTVVVSHTVTSDCTDEPEPTHGPKPYEPEPEPEYPEPTTECSDEPAKPTYSVTAGPYPVEPTTYPVDAPQPSYPATSSKYSNSTTLTTSATTPNVPTTTPEPIETGSSASKRGVSIAALVVAVVGFVMV